MRFFLTELQDSKYRALRQQRLWQVRFIGVSPRHIPCKPTFAGGLITQLRWYFVRPTRGLLVILRNEGSYPSNIRILRRRSEVQTANRDLVMLPIRQFSVIASLFCVAISPFPVYPAVGI